MFFLAGSSIPHLLLFFNDSSPSPSFISFLLHCHRVPLHAFDVHQVGVLGVLLS